MNSETVKRYTALHTWTGLVAGWALFIAFFAGSITVFYVELHDWADPSRRRATAPSMSEVTRFAERIAREHPETAHEFEVALPERGNAVAYWQKFVDGVRAEEYEVSEFVNGRLVPHVERPNVLPDFIYQIHYSLGLPATYGMYLLGFICVIYGLALVSGVVIHAPQLLKDLFALRVGRNLKRLWQDAHNVIGVFSLPFHIIYAYTGAMFCILSLLTVSVNYLALGGRATTMLDNSMQVAEIPKATGIQARPLDTAELVAAARRVAPSFKPTFLIYHNYGDQAGVVDMYGEMSGGLVEQGRVLVNLSTGNIEGRAIPGNAPLGLASMGVMMGLHFGSFGGPLIQWMYFALGLAGALLFYTGNLLWIESRRKRRADEQPRVHIVMAQLTVGICLGCCLGIAALFVANKLPALPFISGTNSDKAVYCIAFLSSVAYALWQPPARAAVHLLATTAAVTTGIPIVNAIATGDHLLRSASDGLWAVFWVDVTTLVFAGVLLTLARTVNRRALHGERNSVWSNVDCRSRKTQAAASLSDSGKVFHP